MNKKIKVLTSLLASVSSIAFCNMIVANNNTSSINNLNATNAKVNKMEVGAKTIGAFKGSVTIEYTNPNECKITKSSVGFIAKDEFNFNGGHFIKDGIEYTITEIADNAFHPSGANWKFEYCTLTIPSTIKKIGKKAFASNHGYHKELVSVYFENGIEEIADSAFENCKNIRMDIIKLPNSLKKLGNKVFSGTNVFSLDLSDINHIIDINAKDNKLQYLGKIVVKDYDILNQYVNSGKLSNYENKLISQTDSFFTHEEWVPGYLFKSNFGDIKLAYKNRNECSISAITRDGDEVVFEVPHTKFDLNGGKINFMGNEYTITEIGDNAFANNGNWWPTFLGSEICIPSTIKRIGNDAFTLNYTPTWAKQKSISSIKISEGVQSIGKYAFSNCSNLTNDTIKLPNSMCFIGMGAFTETKLKYLDLTALDHVINLDFSVFAKISYFGRQIISGCLLNTGLKKIYVKDEAMKAKYIADKNWKCAAKYFEVKK